MKITLAPSFFKSLRNLGSLKSKWYSLRGWFKYHFNKENRHLMRTAWKGRPWDYSFLYDLEKAKLQEMIAYHEKHKRYVGVENDIKWMKLCVNLIDIFTDRKELSHFTGDLKFKPVPGSSDKELDGSDLVYHCDVRVNTKNAHRFVPHGNKNPMMAYWKEHADEIYKKKAKYLYHKIRNEKDESWWD